MTAKIFYFKDAVPSGATLHRSLQDGGTAPTAATTGTGWTPGTNAAGQSCIQNGGSKYSRTGGNWGATLQPSAAPSQTLGDCWRSENPITGKFANADWSIVFRIISAASAYTGRFKLGVRIWRSTDQNGVGAVEITAGRITSAATTADLSTSVVLSLPVTFTPGAEITLNNEYLFVSVGLEITSAGSGNLQDMLFRVSSSALITTSSFSNIFNTSGALPGQLDGVNGSAARFRTHSINGALAGLGSKLSGNSWRYRAHSANGLIAGQASGLSGISRRYRSHAANGVLVSKNSTTSGSSIRYRQHNTNGSVYCYPSRFVGNSYRFRAHSTNGSVAGKTLGVLGTSRRYVYHETNIALIGSGSLLSGLSARHRQHNASGSLLGIGCGLSGLSSIVAAATIPSGHFIITLYRFSPAIELTRHKPRILMTKSNPTIRLKAA